MYTHVQKSEGVGEGSQVKVSGEAVEIVKKKIISYIGGSVKECVFKAQIEHNADCRPLHSLAPLAIEASAVPLPSSANAAHAITGRQCVRKVI